MSSGISRGYFATGIPASVNARTLLSAVPMPREMIAPACPIRFPGGAVRPATYAKTGFRIPFARFAVSSSARPPPSPPHPDPGAWGQPDLRLRDRVHDLVRQRAAAGDDAHVPGSEDVAWHDPRLRLPPGDEARAGRPAPRLDRLDRGILRVRRGDEHDGRVRARRVHGLEARVEHGDALHSGPALARARPRHDLRAIVEHRPGVDLAR